MYLAAELTVKAAIIAAAAAKAYAAADHEVALAVSIAETTIEVLTECDDKLISVINAYQDSKERDIFDTAYGVESLKGLWFATLGVANVVAFDDIVALESLFEPKGRKR